MEKNIIGRFAISKAGHDKDTLYVIVAQEEGFVYLCDGKYHTLEKPKKKSVKHINLCRASVSEELCRRIIGKEKVFDHEVKYAIKMQEKGKEEGYVKE
ncbi:MAG: KOW domain-containing RNA-binding protein [Lachnospiraceae bacterium]|nr:KOW domain-containing RNA-binding protein [Lachnospiraceae bacterium]